MSKWKWMLILLIVIVSFLLLLSGRELVNEVSDKVEAHTAQEKIHE